MVEVSVHGGSCYHSCVEISLNRVFVSSVCKNLCQNWPDRRTGGLAALHRVWIADRASVLSRHRPYHTRHIAVDKHLHTTNLTALQVFLASGPKLSGRRTWR